MKKIVHIIQGLEKGGAETLLCELARRSTSDYAVTVISQTETIDPALARQLEASKVTLITRRKKNGFRLSAVLELWQLLAEIKPDIIHTHLQAAVYAIPWRLFHRKPKWIHTIHSIPDKEFSKFHRMLMFFAYHFLKATPVAISETVLRETLRLYRLKAEKCALIYNGIDVGKFAGAKKDPDGSFDIIHVGSFSPWKNQKMLAEAFGILYREHPDFRLSFVGDGSEKEKVREQCRNLGISSATRFYGISDNVADYLNRSDVFVLCSTFEGLPLTILEAYAAGLPVISTRVGGVVDILTDGQNGFLVESNDAQALADKMLMLYRDKNLTAQIARYNKETAEKYDIAKTAEEYKKIYE